MKRQATESKERAFAVVLTLVLLSLLVGIALAISATFRSNSDLSESKKYQVKARQNALLALKVGMAELQIAAGPDARVTGMAGVTGVTEGDAFRQWAGVWGGSISPQWLTSGANQGGVPSLSTPPVLMVKKGSAGTAGGDKEWVEAGLITITQSNQEYGRYAYWVADEGAKISAVVLDVEAQVGTISSRMLRPDTKRLVSTKYTPEDPSLINLISREQLRVVASNDSLLNSFHALSLSHHALPTTAPNGLVLPSGYVTGAININTTSVPFWRALLEYPDRYDVVYKMNSLSNARNISERIEGRTAPFDYPSQVADSGVLQDALTASPKVVSPTAQEFTDDVLPILTVRSDTFRIRAYGDAINPADALETNPTPEAVAYCEAIVQRTPEIIDSVGGPLGRRFVITYFRWLGPDDI